MGGGIKLKIIEAALKQKAIVGVEGSVAVPGFIAGKHFLEARDYSEMIDFTIKLVNDPELCRFLVNNTCELLNKNFLQKNISAKLERFLQETIMTHRRNAEKH
jgi:hypothetical protein